MLGLAICYLLYANIANSKFNLIACLSMQFITLDIKKTDSTKQEIKRFNFSKHMSS